MKPTPELVSPKPQRTGYAQDVTDGSFFFNRIEYLKVELRAGCRIDGPKGGRESHHPELM
jgi:hypothetical protein